MSEPVVPRPAATVIVLRADAEGAACVLLLRRAQSASFFPHAWVFPGGRVEPEDALLGVCGGGVLAAPPWRAPAVAAVRECFEESGVWLGQGAPSPDLRARLNDRSATLLDGGGLVADLDRLRPWAWWITPPEEPKRFDTRFFVAVVDARAMASADAAETVDHRWLRPADALADRGVGLAPPTFRTLEELAALHTVEAIWQAAASRRIVPIQPRLDRGPDGVIITLPGHVTLPSDAPAAGPHRIAWRGDRWISED